MYKPWGPTTRSLGDFRSPWLLTMYPSHGMILQVGPDARPVIYVDRSGDGEI